MDDRDQSPPDRAPSDEITIGVIGCGHWGPNLARNFLSLAGSRLRWICDTNRRRLEALGPSFPGVARTTEAADLIGDRSLDAVVVCTPADTHHRVGRAVLESGKHLFIEKPLATNSQDAEDLVQLAAKLRLTLMVSHVFLFNAAVRVARDRIAQGDLGRIHYITSVRTNLGPLRADVDVTWDLLPHDLSIFSYWLGAEPISVTAKGGRYLSEKRMDMVSVTLTFPGGVIAHVLASWLAPRKIREITIVADRRMLLFDDMNASEPVRIYDQSVAKESLTGTFTEFQMLTRHGDTLIPHIRPAEPLREACQHFLHCVASGSPPLTDGQSGLRVVRTLEAIERSAGEGSRELRIESV